MINKILLGFSILLFLCTSCSNWNKTQNVNGEGCIKPLETFAYPLTTEDGLSLTERLILPASPWVVYTEFPKKNLQNGYIPLYLADIRIKGKQLEFWVKTVVYNAEEPKYGFLLYDMNGKTWKEVPVEIIPGLGQVQNIFVTDTGEVYGENYYSQIISGLNREYFPFSKYNEELNIFELDTRNKDIPFHLSGDGRSIVFDPKGLIWFLLPGDAIYQYDINTALYKQVTDISNVGSIVNATLGTDGNIYFMEDPPILLKKLWKQNLLFFSTTQKPIPLMK
jgi:hypothetical protein